METHALLSPSAAHRWLACPASVAVSEHEPDTPGAAAQEGTRAHELAQAILTGEAVDLPQDFTPVYQYTDLIKALAAGGVLLVETRVHPPGLDDCHGTADAIILTREGELQIHDLKYGYTPVSAQHNPQMMLYALGAMQWAQLVAPVTAIRLFIHQPRLARVSEWQCPPDELAGFHEQAVQAAQRALSYRARSTLPDYAFHPSDEACRYCRVRYKCKARESHVMQILTGYFDPVEKLPMPIHLIDPATPEKLSEAYKLLPLVESWCDDVRRQALDCLNHGGQLPGFKLVQGRAGNRIWRDEEEAARVLEPALGEAAWIKKLASVAVAEKLLGKTSKALLADLVTRPEGKPSVVPEDDPRPALNTNPFL